jgi:hypothetical protein
MAFATAAEVGLRAPSHHVFTVMPWVSCCWLSDRVVGADVALNVTSCFAAVAVSVGLLGLTVDAGVANAEPSILAPLRVITSPPPTGIGWSWEWDTTMTIGNRPQPGSARRAAPSHLKTATDRLGPTPTAGVRSVDNAAVRMAAAQRNRWSYGRRPR